MVRFYSLLIFFVIFYFDSLFESINAFQLNTKFKNKNRFLSMNIDKNSVKEVVNLMKNNEHSPYGLLSTINFNKNVEGYPFVSLAGFVVSDTGFPVFCFSKMSKHTKNLNKIDSDGFSKASLYIRESNVPWDKDVISNKRLTFTGNINKIDYEGLSKGDEYWDEYSEYYKNLYKKVHPEAFWVDFPDFEMYKMDFIKDIYYIGGFSKATKISVDKYLKEFNLDDS